MSRRKLPPLPAAPFAMGDLVKFRTRDGAELVGNISLVGWLPFPGMWSFEIKTADGITHQAPGNVKEIEKAEPAPAADPEAELRRIWAKKGVSEERQAEILADITAKAQAGAMVGPFEIGRPMVEQTPAGAQAVIAGAEGRRVPDSKLKPKKNQRESLTALEAGAIDDKQESLF